MKNNQGLFYKDFLKFFIFQNKKTKKKRKYDWQIKSFPFFLIRIKNKVFLDNLLVIFNCIHLFIENYYINM